MMRALVERGFNNLELPGTKLVGGDGPAMAECRRHHPAAGT